jgi:hypothetical protein
LNQPWNAGQAAAIELTATAVRDNHHIRDYRAVVGDHDRLYKAPFAFT